MNHEPTGTTQQESAAPAPRPRERTLEELLRQAALALSCARREHTLEDLCAAVADLLDVEVVILGRTDDGAVPPAIDMLCYYVDGRFVRPQRYALAGTPCETVVGGAFEFYPSGLGTLFPTSDADMHGIEGYAAYPLYASDGRALGILAVLSRRPLAQPSRFESLLRIFATRVATEIERMRAEHALRESEEYYRGIFNASLDALAVLKTDGTFVDVNPALERMYGYARHELVGRTLFDFMPHHREAVGVFLDEVLRQGSARSEDRARRRDGSSFRIEPRGVLINFKGEPHVLVIARDVTADKARQVALRQSEDRLRATVQSALDPIIAMDAAGRVLDFNPAAERCFRLCRDEVVGRLLDEVLARPRLRGAEHAPQGCCEPGDRGLVGRRTEVTMTRADGSEFPAELAIGTARGAGGDVLVWYVRDVSERLQAEKERAQLEGQLRQAQKMEALGHLTGGIAHDFNNILTSVLGYVAMAREQLEAAPDARLERYLERAQRSGERARDLIQQMLTFSRGQQGERRPLDLGALVGEAVSLLESLVPASIGIETACEGNLPEVIADPVHVQQILMNLCINARDAMEGTGRLSIVLAARKDVHAACSACLKPVAGNYVELCVADTGPGIPARLVERIFEPFFTTKETGKGSGMGLAMVHGIVHEYGGHVLVDSHSGGGTRMRVLFPADFERAPAPLAVTPTPQPASTGALAGRVVVCDDNAEVGAFLADLLTGWQLDVRVFQDAVAALKYCEMEPGLDLVVVDQTMPVITGLELGQLLRRRRPQLPIVLYTGYSETVSEDVVRRAGLDALVRKPLDIPAFHCLLQGLLERRTAGAADAGKATSSDSMAVTN